MGRYAVSQYTGTRIREVLREMGKTQAWLAKAMGLTDGSVSNSLSGRYRFSQQFVERACAALNRAEGDLFFIAAIDSSDGPTKSHIGNTHPIGHSGHRPTSGQADAAGAGSGAQSGQPTGQEVQHSNAGTENGRGIPPGQNEHPVSLHSGCSAQC